MIYTSCGEAAISASIGDRIVYRNLVPADPRLPSIADLRHRLSLRDDELPRKAERSYGMVLAAMLREARRMTLPSSHLTRLVYIGDTRMNDGTAFANLCAAEDWAGWAFIGCDRPAESPHFEIDGNTYLANRWSALPAFQRFLATQGLAMDEDTAVVLDMDKTFVGARGRNDTAIDAARLDAVFATVSAIVGSDMDSDAFRKSYEILNQSSYHPFTADNQDYLVYICLIISSGLVSLESLLHNLQSTEMRRFDQFLANVQSQRRHLTPKGLLDVHDSVWSNVQAGDPTPFKAFRYNEYLSTARRFGDLPGVSMPDLLRQRILITEEVREFVLDAEARGALTFAISDKPDEASLPSQEQALAGMKPLHRLPTIAVREVTPAVGDGAASE